MVASRTSVALVGLLIGFSVSVAAWYVFETLLLFLFLPFVPFVFGRAAGSDADRDRPVRECPRCAFRTTDPEYEYCPRDGSRLERDAFDRR